MKSQLSALKAEHAPCADLVARLAKQSSSHDEVQQKYDTLTVEHQSCQQTIAMLRQKLADMAREHGDLEERNTAIDEVVVKLRKQVAEMEIRNTQLEEERITVEKSMISRNVQLSTHEADKQELEKSLDLLRREHASCADRILSLEVDIQRLNGMNADLKRTVADRDEEVLSLHAQVTAYKQKFETLSLAHEPCSNLHAGLERELAEVKRSHAQCDQLASESRNQVRLAAFARWLCLLVFASHTH